MSSTATGLNISVSLGVSGTYQKLIAINTASIPTVWSHSVTFTLGTGSGQANIWGESSASISGATNVDIYGGLNDPFGQSVTLTKLKLLIIENMSTTSGQILNVDGNWITGTFGASTIIPVHPQSPWVIASEIDGLTVTTSTLDTITLTPSSGTLTYRLFAIGHQ